jgi:glycosyltransferase involved in cell wall biosynthesis
MNLSNTALSDHQRGSDSASWGKGLEGVCLIVDARKVQDGGIGRYILNLLDGLISYTAVDLTVICFSKHEEFFHASFKGRIKMISIDTKLYSTREILGMRWDLPWKRYDLAHFPHFTVPMGLPIPSVVTIHDLIQITHPEKWYYPYVARFYIRNALKRGAAVIAVSQQTAAQLSTFDRNGRIINVIPNSIGRSRERERARRPMNQILPGYFLCVLSNNKPHKGLYRLLEAFQILTAHYSEARSLLPACGMILIGRGAPMTQFSGGMGMGGVSESELEWYYENARAIVVASDVEGFCLPVIESRRFGVPAVVTPIPAIREILSPFDIVADDFSSSALARAMSQLLQQPPPTLSAMNAELERFELQRTTRQIARLYDEVLKTTPGDRT